MKKFLNVILDNAFYGYLTSAAILFFYFFINTLDFEKSLIGGLFFGIGIMSLVAFVLAAIESVLPEGTQETPLLSTAFKVWKIKSFEKQSFQYFFALIFPSFRPSSADLRLESLKCPIFNRWF